MELKKRYESIKTKDKPIKVRKVKAEDDNNIYQMVMYSDIHNKYFLTESQCRKIYGIDLNNYVEFIEKIIKSKLGKRIYKGYIDNVNETFDMVIW